MPRNSSRKRCLKLVGRSPDNKKQHFALSRSEFEDAINIRYYRQLKGLPAVCPCSQKFTITHALNCRKGGLIHMRHDNVRDFLAGLLEIVQHDVQTEPPLQLTTTESTSASGNTADGARLDIRAKGFWRDAQDPYFDVRITNPLTAIKSQRMYKYIVMSVEQGTFTPLVFTTTGSTAPECALSAAFLKKLSIKIAEKRNERLSDVTTWVRCKISFMCLRAVLMCLRGTRKSKMNYISENFSVDTIESRIG